MSPVARGILIRYPSRYSVNQNADLRHLYPNGWYFVPTRRLSRDTPRGGVGMPTGRLRGDAFTRPRHYIRTFAAPSRPQTFHLSLERAVGASPNRYVGAEPPPGSQPPPGPLPLSHFSPLALLLPPEPTPHSGPPVSSLRASTPISPSPPPSKALSRATSPQPPPGETNHLPPAPILHPHLLLLHLHLLHPTPAMSYALSPASASLILTTALPSSKHSLLLLSPLLVYHRRRRRRRHYFYPPRTPSWWWVVVIP